MEESYNEKWKQFLNEDFNQDEVISNIQVLLQDEMPLHVEVYVDSVKRDFMRGDIQQYVGFTDDDIIEDFENYIADKLDS